jgi:hypothetical protein
MTDNAAEIAKIEHELEILRSRYAIFAYWARVVKWFCIAAAVIIPALLALAATPHPVMALFMTFFIVFVVLVFWLASPGTGRFRWIDLVSPGPRVAWGGFAKMPASEAMAIESMITQREARLADLRSAGG